MNKDKLKVYVQLQLKDKTQSETCVQFKDKLKAETLAKLGIRGVLPSFLSQLKDDSLHRTVTDEQILKWDSEKETQPDWQETDENSNSFIRNKPSIIEEQDGSIHIGKDSAANKEIFIFDELFLKDKKIQSELLDDSVAILDKDQTFTGKNTFEDDVFIGTDTTNKRNLFIYGDIYQNGSVYETHIESLLVKDSLIFLRDGSVSPLLNDEFTGIIAKKYDGENDGALIFDNKGVARVGDITFIFVEVVPIPVSRDAYNGFYLRFSDGSGFSYVEINPNTELIVPGQTVCFRMKLNDQNTVPLAGREENPLDAGFARWDSSTMTFKTVDLQPIFDDSVKKSELSTLSEKMTQPIGVDEDGKLWAETIDEEYVHTDYNYDETAKEKVDVIIIDGDGKKALMNDGTYSEAGKVDTISINKGTKLLPDEEKNIDITVPTKVSDIENDSNFQTENEVSTSIQTHNTSQIAHNNIRTLISNIVDGITEVSKALESKDYNTQTGSIKTKFEELITAINSLSVIVNSLKGATVSQGQIDELTEDVTQEKLNAYIESLEKTPQQGYVVYDLNDNEWEHNGEEWVNNGKFVNTPATNEQTGTVIGGEYISILAGVMTVLKSLDANKLGGQLPAFYATQTALTTLISIVNLKPNTVNNIEIDENKNISITGEDIKLSTEDDTSLAETFENFNEVLNLKPNTINGVSSDENKNIEIDSKDVKLDKAEEEAISLYETLEGIAIGYGQVRDEIENHATILKDNSYNGFITQPTSVVFANSTRMLELNGEYDIYVSSKKFSKENDSFEISNIEGQHHIFYNENGEIQELVNNYNLDLIKKYCFIASIYWDAENQKQILMAAEYRHGMVMDGDTHAWIHESQGLVIITGGELGDLETDEDASLDAHCQFSNISTIVRDEDARFNHLARLKTSNLPVYYRIGADIDQIWRVKEDNSFPVVNGTNGRACYNRLLSGNWSAIEYTDNLFVLAHVVTTNDIDRPYAVFMGQSGYASLTTARQGAREEINNLILSGLPFKEIKFIATILIQSNNNFTNTPKSRIRTLDDGSPYIDLRGEIITRSGVTGGSVQDHNDLAGIQGGAEGDFQHLKTEEVIKINNAILKTPVTLTEAEKTQARTNISAGTSSFSGNYADLVGEPDLTIYETVSGNNSKLALKLDKKPNGTMDLLDGNNKINTVYVPDYLLGQMLYGGSVSGATATLSSNAKTKLGTTSATITLTNNTTAITGYKANEGIYYLASAVGTFADITFAVGDWLISTGAGWSKIDNTDAVTGIKGDSESTYRIGNVNITKANIGLGNAEDTADLDKPINTATQTALNLKATKLNIAQDQVPRKTGAGTGEPNSGISYTTSATASTLMCRDADGRVRVVAGTENTHAVNKSQLDTKDVQPYSQHNTAGGNGYRLVAKFDYSAAPTGDNRKVFRFKVKQGHGNGVSYVFWGDYIVGLGTSNQITCSGLLSKSDGTYGKCGYRVDAANHTIYFYIYTGQYSAYYTSNITSLTPGTNGTVTWYTESGVTSDTVTEGVNSYYPTASGTLATTSQIPTNHVTTDTVQTITANKTLSGTVTITGTLVI